MPGGRPSSYTPEIGDAICAEIAMDRATLEELCERDGMPDRGTVWRWQKQHDEFRDAYERAREEQAHSIVDKQAKLRRLVETGKIDPAVALASHKIGSWEAGKRLPKRYGDRIQHANDPVDPMPTMKVEDVVNGLDAILRRAGEKAEK